MERTLTRFIIVIGLALLALFQTMTGLIMWLAFPENGEAGHDGVEATFWSLSQHTWAIPHRWAA